MVDRRFILGDPEKEAFRRILRQCETFYGLHILTYCIMSNHFHVLIQVPEPVELSEEDVLHRIEALYSAKFVAGLRQDLDALRQAGQHSLAQARLDSFSRRMGSLSNFMKSLKQRFSSFYNRNHQRSGTLWEERFRSVIVEGDERALLTMALYIDLNPIRAGLVSDPAEYRFCGYAEAVGGGHAAREGLLSLVSWIPRSWRSVQAEYRRLLYSTGEETSIRKGFSREETAAVEAREGHLPAGAALRHRIRYLSEGVILGSRGFIDSWLDQNRWRFGRERAFESPPRRLLDIALLRPPQTAPG
ncbi:MAG: Transposase IS200 like protein [Synergistetes bacterium ADurb.BinA166]|nr:MAG: Transposase IS200 like protein [Synergistetes bacterium ADurb.BinA166]